MAAIFEFPLTNDLPSYKFRITLSGSIFTVHLHFNTRMQRWIMDINDAADAQVLQGIPVLILTDLTNQYRYLAVPAGTLFCVDDTDKDSQPTQFSFGQTHTMFYIDPLQ